MPTAKEEKASEKQSKTEKIQLKNIPTNTRKITQDKPEQEEEKQASSLVIHTMMHTKRVESFANQIFMSLKPLHNLGSEYSRILCSAAHLHDLGWIYGRQSHHKTSGKIIREYAKKKSFTPKNDTIEPHVQKQIEEILKKSLAALDEHSTLLVSMIARYHRKSDPSFRHKLFNKLNKKEQKIVCQLSGILKVADALDYSHAAIVKAIKVEVDKREIRLTLDCDNAHIAEKERVDEKKQLLQDTFERVLICNTKKKAIKK